MQSEERDEAWKRFCGRGYEIPDDPHDLFRSEDYAQSNETLEERVSSCDGRSARLTATSVNHNQGIWLERFRPAKEVVESMTELAKWQQILKHCAAIQDTALLRDTLRDESVQACSQESLTKNLFACDGHFDTEIEAAVNEGRWDDAEDWQITKAAATVKILTRFGMETGKLREAYMSLQDSLDHVQAWNKTHSGPLSKTVIREDLADALMKVYNDPEKVPDFNNLDEDYLRKQLDKQMIISRAVFRDSDSIDSFGQNKANVTGEYLDHLTAKMLLLERVARPSHRESGASDQSSMRIA